MLQADLLWWCQGCAGIVKPMAEHEAFETDHEYFGLFKEPRIEAG